MLNRFCKLQHFLGVAEDDSVVTDIISGVFRLFFSGTRLSFSLFDGKIGVDAVFIIGCRKTEAWERIGTLSVNFDYDEVFNVGKATQYIRDNSTYTTVDLI